MTVLETRDFGRSEGGIEISLEVFFIFCFFRHKEIKKVYRRSELVMK